MVKASDNPFPNVTFDEQASDIATPASDRWVLYTKSGGVYARNAAGTITGPFGTAGGASTFVGVHAYNSANVALNNGSTTVVTLDSERFDTDAFHSTVSNTSRLTVPAGKAGKYLIGASVEITNSSSGAYRHGILRLNGTTDIANASGIINATASAAMSLSCVYDLAVADYVELTMFVNAGSLNALATPNRSPEVWMSLLGT